MADRYVVSKSRMVRIPCDGPLTAQVERLKLEREMAAAGLRPDVEIEYSQEPVLRARPEPRRERGTKLRTNRVERLSS
jgi:hypothetical protein